MDVINLIKDLIIHMIYFAVFFTTATILGFIILFMVIWADDRELLVKLVKQNNTIVQYLKGLEIEMVDEYGEPITKEEEQRIKKSEELKEVLDEFMAKRKDLKEFEKELKKNKDMLTPGQVGES